MRSGPNNSRRAFTLVEALAVVTVVGIVLPAAMYCISLAENGAALVKERARASEIASNQLNIAMLSGQYQGSGDDTGHGPVYHWAIQQQERDTNLEELTISVTWSSGRQPREFTLTTLVYTLASAVGTGTGIGGAP